jgi:hypothetical protein
MEQLAPNLMKFVKPAAKNLTVAMALQEDRWVTEIFFPTKGAFITLEKVLHPASA